MLLNEEKTVFYDSKIDNNDQPLEFSSGEGLVPEGFEMCTRLMLPGEIALVTCPPDYAYDKFPRPPGVSEGAHVQWEIELLGFETPRVSWSSVDTYHGNCKQLPFLISLEILSQDWTGLNFQSIMDEADKIRSTVWIKYSATIYNLTYSPKFLSLQNLLLANLFCNQVTPDLLIYGSSLLLVIL
jgi:hypothetical protein